mmetsp:Transcript_34357/g.110375  ORF Transcript_34357/g.110375 Transcript_34357/m.110375 type:complete len:604 (-) Transcript_34357:2026-3837(-)
MDRRPVRGVRRTADATTTRGRYTFMIRASSTSPWASASRSASALAATTRPGGRGKTPRPTADYGAPRASPVAPARRTPPATGRPIRRKPKKDFWADRHHRGSNRRVVECNAGHCAASYECKLGYQAHSRLCAVLRPSEYFQLGGLRPTPCLFRNHAGLRVVVYSVVLAMVFAFWLWYNLKVAPRHTSAALFNNGLQMMALVSLFVGVNFPSNNVFGFLQILYNFALFDADILTPSCVVRWSPIHSLYASVFVECFSLVFFAPAVAALLWRSLFDRDFVRDNERLFRRIALVERSVSSPAVVSSMGDHQMTTNNWCLTGRESSRLLLHKEQHEKNVQGLPATLEGPAGLLWAVDTSAPHTGGGPGFMTLERYGRHLSAGAASNDSASDSSPNKQQRKSGDAAAAVQKQQKPDFPKAKWWWLVVGWPRAIRAACHFYVGELGLEAAQACASALILVEANYANVSVKFMLALSCRDGHMHLDPTIRCASRKRRAIFIFALLGVFALVGFLVVLYVVMRRAYRRVQGLHEPHLLARLGWLYSEFKSKLRCRKKTKSTTNELTSACSCRRGERPLPAERKKTPCTLLRLFCRIRFFRNWLFLDVGSCR